MKQLGVYFIYESQCIIIVRLFFCDVTSSYKKVHQKNMEVSTGAIKTLSRMSMIISLYL